MNQCAEEPQQSVIQQRLRGLIDQHHKNLLREIEGVRPHFLAIGSSKPIACPACEQAIAISHKIAGSSGSMGFNDISQAAKKTELHLKSLTEIDGNIPAADRDLVRQHFDELEALIAKATVEDSELYFAEDL